ncbi:MAG: DM9 repeat-containing protein [Nostoc sp.]
MNLSNFRIKTTLAGLAILAGTVIPASPTFAQNTYANAVFAGNDVDSTPMYVCAGIWNNGVNNGVYPGKSRANSGTCDISYAGLEHWVPLSNSILLQGPPTLSVDINDGEAAEYRYTWEPSSELQQIPGTAIPTGFENGYSLYSCRVSQNGYYTVGKLRLDKVCYYGFASYEASATSYDVLTLDTFGISTIR